MTAKTWATGVGDWDTAADWSPSGVPGSADTVAITDTGSPQVDSDVGTISSLMNVGYFSINQNGVLRVTTTLVNSQNLYVGGTPNNVAQGTTGPATLVVGGKLTNSGNFTLGDLAKTAGAVTATLGSIANTGELNLDGDSGASETVSMAIGSAAGFGTGTTLTGTVSLAGDASIQFASGSISAIAAASGLTLDGAATSILDQGQGNNSALSGLTSVIGALTMENGSAISLGTLSVSGTLSMETASSLATTGNLTNTGNIYVDDMPGVAFGTGGCDLAIGGTFTNASSSAAGTLTVGNASQTAAETVTAAGIVNAVGSEAGTIVLKGNSADASVMDVASTAGFGTAGTLTGNALLDAAALGSPRPARRRAVRGPPDDACRARAFLPCHRPGTQGG